MHKHYIYRSNELVAVLSGDALVDMLDSIRSFIITDISSQKTFSSYPAVRLSKLTESDEAVFTGVTEDDEYIYVVKSSWQS